jgi:uncharacterized surface protein with fasciclin (FAS1) repeats
MTDQLNLVETIAKDDKFSVFTRLLKSSKADGLFDGAGPFTVFAPTNDAFGKLGDKELDKLVAEAGQTTLKALLSYHVFPGKWMAANVVGLGNPKSVTGEEVKFTDSNGLMINQSKVQARNIEAKNGVVHAIDTVLTPTVAVAAATGSSIA